MPGAFEKKWADAKKNFEATTGRKKPTGGFMGMVHASGLTAACQGLDRAASREESAAMDKALAQFSKQAKEYKKTLSRIAAGNYSDNVKISVSSLEKALDEIEAEFTALYEETLPVEIRLPGSISSSKNVFRRAKTKVLKTGVSPFEVSFQEKTLRVAKMVEDEGDRLIQHLILESSNFIARMERELADQIEYADQKIVKNNGVFSDEDKKLLGATCRLIVEHYQKKIKENIQDQIDDYFEKTRIAKAYKRGVIIKFIKFDVAFVLAATSVAVTGGAALIPLLITCASTAKNIASIIAVGARANRGLKKSEQALLSKKEALVELYRTSSRKKIEIHELKIKLGAVWLSGIGSLEDAYNEYTAKSVAYENTVIPPLEQEMKSLGKALAQIKDEDRELHKKLVLAYQSCVNTLAAENGRVREMANLRITAKKDIAALKANRMKSISNYQAVSAGIHLAEMASAARTIGFLVNVAMV